MKFGMTLFFLKRLWGRLDEQERRLTTLEAVRKG